MVRARSAAQAVLAAAAITGAGLVGCSSPCCEFDSQAIELARASGGELVARLATPSGSPDGTSAGVPFDAIVDTGSSINLWHRPSAPGTVVKRTVLLLGAGAGAPLRGRFSGVPVATATIAVAGRDGAPFQPLAILGGEFLSAFSVAFDFSVPSLRLYTTQPAGNTFLASAGYAVLRLRRHGGGELAASAPGDDFGQRAPHAYPPSLLVVRACGAATPWQPADPIVPGCDAGKERAFASGADLALVVSTGVGPVVLARSAWSRIVPALPDAPAGRTAPLHLTRASGPTTAEWFQIPRLALVDREVALADDLGPCVELGRARRLEQVVFQQLAMPDALCPPCAQACDLDGDTDGDAHDSAAYISFDRPLNVAVVDDTHPVLQSLRAEIRPAGPEIDGILGAAALRDARLEIDYRSDPARAIFSCAPGAAGCRAISRCPRLPDGSSRRVCYGLPAHGLPEMCKNRPAACVAPSSSSSP